MQEGHDGGDSNTLYVMAAGAPAATTSLFEKAAGGQPVSERAFMQHLEAAKLIRAVIVTLKGGEEGKADLTWQDASAAFQMSGGGSPLGAPEYATAIALCGLVKYGGVPTLSSAQKVEGFLANVSGSKDEHTVIGTPGH